MARHGESVCKERAHAVSVRELRESMYALPSKLLELRESGRGRGVARERQRQRASVHRHRKQ